VLGKEPQEYKYIARFFDAAMDKIGQSFGHQNGFDLKPKYPWKQNNCSRRAFWFDIFAILMPQSRN
jgi:hypothetical protein